MYNYYIESSAPKGTRVDIHTPQIGQLSNSELLIKGMLVIEGELEKIEFKGIFSDVIKANVLFSLAKEHNLNLSATQRAYRFSIRTESVEIIEDFHYSITATLNENNNFKLAYGFFQTVDKVDDIVFVIGSPRSGTSALGKALRRGLGARAHGESHVIEGFRRINEQNQLFFEDSVTARIKGNLVHELPKTLLLAEQLTVLRRVYKLYYGDKVHLDKTPGIPMINSLPLVFMAWPNAKVILCKRRGLENIASRIIKFPKVPFEGHLKQWVQSFKAWRKNKQQVTRLLKKQNWFIEVEQREMAITPQKVVNEVSQFVGLNGQKKQKLYNALSGERPEQSSAIDSAAKSINDFGWTKDQITLFRSVCTQEMELQSYTFDEHYTKSE